MLKRILACFCSFLVVFSFCCQCFVVSAAGTEGGSGGGGHRGDYVELNRAPIDTEKTQAQINAAYVEGFQNNILGYSEDFFYYALGTAGAIFSDETTLKSVRNQFNAIYVNALSSPDEMRKIFYYGTDGQLYFTDEFLSQFRAIVDENSFNQGVFSIPFCRSDVLFQRILGYGMLYCTNTVTSCLSGNDARLIAPQIATGKDFSCIDLGFSIYDFSVLAPFSTFSDYRSFYNAAISGQARTANFYFCTLSDDSVSYYWNSSPLIYKTKPDNDGSFSVADSSYAYNNNSSSTKFHVSSGISSAYDYSAWFFVGVGSFEAYRSADWVKFYTSGGTGVIRGNTYYAMDNAQNPDNIFGNDWKAYYQGLQKQYKDLAGEVASGNKTLKEINQTLSDEILDTVADISQDVTQQTNYLKKILNELESISGKLTYSNVVETVSAASNLLSAVCDVLDSLFSSDDGVFSLLDFVETYVLDGTGKTIASVMQTVFPFSLPHDFYLILELLSVNPETPQVHFKFDLARLGMSYDYSYTANDFEKLAYMTRFFSSVGFVLLLINFTNKILKK